MRFRVGPLRKLVLIIRDNERYPGTPIGRAARLRPEGLQVRFLLWVLKRIRPRGAVWSARHPVKVEVVGSNPIGDADMVRCANLVERRISNVRDCGFDSLPYYFFSVKQGHWAV